MTLNLSFDIRNIGLQIVFYGMECGRRPSLSDTRELFSIGLRVVAKNWGFPGSALNVHIIYMQGTIMSQVRGVNTEYSRVDHKL